AAARASRRKRWRRSGFARASGRGTLRATARPRRVSSARKTIPNPPRPKSRWIRNGPRALRGWPGVRAQVERPQPGGSSDWPAGRGHWAAGLVGAEHSAQRVDERVGNRVKLAGGGLAVRTHPQVVGDQTAGRLRQVAG